MLKKTVIIHGSARGDGDTNLIVEHLNKNGEFDIIKLSDFTIGHFDYKNKNATDDFLPLMEKITLEYETLLIATPVYWYSMSGRMKVFFDRISDLLVFRKDIGRKLRGKNMATLSISNANDLKPGFEMPFEASADYLGMHFLGHTHVWVKNEVIEKEVLKRLNRFKTLLTLP